MNTLRKLPALLTIIKISILFLLPLFLINACDHTKLQGNIIFQDTEIVLGETIHLQLEIPKNLDGIYWVHWEIEPKEAGQIIYPGPSVDTTETDVLKKYGKEDRNALFIPLQKGTIIISTYGFYKQTNPQFIYDTTVVVY